ncbi:MFS transporter [Gordonia rhizosphera]|uniref:Putative major facilitator superfamily transporter n=1 Tax=Gordonia rhizosphera NBRC 16068 TaxID=1108045 RepID=K6V3H9_9ACTN|nr:MFS transporter [Gordonia rhizosphera]GAB90643.1 putative major facilitator superfamily transporter [Gordonia rhizosphera NBRC 16068]
MTAPHPLDDAPLSTFHKKLALFASGGPFLDGYVLSIIGVALVQISPDFGLSSAQEGLVGASALVGILLGAFAGGWLTDKFGRQVLFTIDLALIIGCSIAQAFVGNVWWLIGLRLLIGMAVGADYPIATSLLAEFSPRRWRGPLLGAFVAMWFVGAVAAYFVGEALMHVDGGWRWMLASAAVPAIIIVLARIGTPESPRWLMKKERVDEANAVLQKVFGPGVSVDDLPEEVHENIRVSALLRSGYGKRMAFISIFWTCSIVPLFAVYAFGPKILGALGLTGTLANYGSAFITLMFLVGCLVGLALVNRMGRRPLIIHSFAWAGLALLLLGIFTNASAWLVLALFAAYAVTIGGTQILQWIYPNELFPTEVRGSAVGLASSLSRIGAAIGTYLVPVSLSHLGTAWTMIVGAIVTFVGAGVSILWAPETRGLTLGECASIGAPSPEPTAKAA